MLRHLSNVDMPVTYCGKFREYGIENGDGGTSYQLIAYCPWCGTKLPAPLRDEWFDVIEALGLEPEDTRIPVPYQSEKWWMHPETVAAPEPEHRPTGASETGERGK